MIDEPSDRESPTTCSAPLAVWSASLATGVELFATGWQASLARGPRVKLASVAPQMSRPGAVSFSIAPPKLRTTSFRFPDLDGWRAKAESKAAPATACVESPTAATGPGNEATVKSDSPAARSDAPSLEAPTRDAPASTTRIRPPDDCIKLEDRLYYLLQPALEVSLQASSLAFPFHPFDYQLEGIAFLYPRVAAVLADEMGLGKTMQAITAIRLLLHAGEIRSALLVCPKPLVTNWQREFHRWAPELPLVAIEGDSARRRWQWLLGDAPVKVANYEILQRDKQILADENLAFDLVVLDEAQRIKNRSGATSQVVREITRRRSWALTGTPIENSGDDLVGIFEFVAPGQLTSDMKPRALGRAASPYVLRRTKDKVLTELPPKLFRDADLELSPEQRESYALAENEGVVRLGEMGDDLTIQHVFELVLRLKQICNFDPSTGASSKCERLVADLEEVTASGRKAIVFSQWVHSITTLSERLAAFRPLEFHGKIPSAKRDGVIQQFREDPRSNVMLISYGAGSVGLNLQFSEYVFLFDRWWNPAIEDQAINRAHRIGAAGPVTVTRFLAVDTIEQRIDQVLSEKREIFDTIFSDVEPHERPGLTQREIFGLFNLRCPAGPIRIAA